MADDDHLTMRQKARGTADIIRYVLAALLLVALVVFALANTDDANVDYVAGDTSAPLILVMAGSAVAGALIAALVRQRRHHS